MNNQRTVTADNPLVPWWLVLVEGIAAIFLGILLFMRPAATTILLIQFLGIYWLITGIFSIVSLFWDSSDWGWKLFTGILGILAGTFIIQHLIWSTLLVPATMAIVLGIIGLVIGIFQLIDAFRGGGWGIGILGVLSILLGILLITRPVLAGLALPYMLGGLLVVGGILAIILAFSLRDMQEQAKEARMQVASSRPSSDIAAETDSSPTVDVSEAALTGNVSPTDPEEMAKFKNLLEYVEGIGPVYGEKLKAIGLTTCLDLLKSGATRKGREEIAERSGISGKLVLEWVNQVDLYRIKGVGSEYADLLEATGVDTVIELAQRNASNLFEKMVVVNEEKELVRQMPTAAQVEDWVYQAKGLPRVVTY